MMSKMTQTTLLATALLLLGASSCGDRCEQADKAFDVAAKTVEQAQEIAKQAADAVDAACNVVGDPAACETARDFLAEVTARLEQAKRLLAQAKALVELLCGSLTNDQASRYVAADVPPQVTTAAAWELTEPGDAVDFYLKQIPRESRKITDWLDSVDD